MPDSVFAKHCHLWWEPELYAWHLWKWLYSRSHLLVPPNPGFWSRRRKKKSMPHTMKSGFISWVVCKFILLHICRVPEKTTCPLELPWQEICVLKQAKHLRSTFTCFSLVPSGNSGNSSYDGIRFLSDQSRVWAVGSVQLYTAFLWRFSIWKWSQ